MPYTVHFPLHFLMFHTHFLDTQHQEIRLLSQCEKETTLPSRSPYLYRLCACAYCCELHVAMCICTQSASHLALCGIQGSMVWFMGVCIRIPIAVCVCVV